MNYKILLLHVIVEGDYKLGDKVEVKIVKTERFCLKGEVMSKVKKVVSNQIEQI